MKQLKQLFQKANVKIGVGAGLLLAGANAHAVYTPPAAATEAWTNMGEAFTWVETNMWTVGAVVVVGFFVFALFKKAANKAK